MLTAHASAFVRGDSAIRAKRAESTKVPVRRAIEAKESRIGKVPVAVPKGVTYTLKNNMLSVKVRIRESFKSANARADVRTIATSRANLFARTREGLRVIGFSRAGDARARKYRPASKY